jgi:hypothetical protein
MKVFKPGSMMQEHRKYIKRASAEAEDSWKASNTNFENTLEMLHDLK